MKVSVSPISGVPVAPADISDAVTTWARNQGRRSRGVEWDQESGCFVIRLSRRADDPVHKARQEGRISEEDTHETVYLQGWVWTDERAGQGKLLPYDLDQFGPTGIIELLDKGNMATGRGEYSSLQQYIGATVARNRQKKEAWKRQAEDQTRETASRYRRKVLGLPQVPVIANLKMSQT